MGKNLNSVRKNFVYSFLYDIVMILAPLIVTPYISRVLGVELVGIRSYTFAILTYFELLSNMGIAIYGQREIAKTSDNKEARSRVFFELFVIKTISFSVATCLYCAFVFGLSIFEQYRVVFAIWLIHLSESFFNITWFFQGIERFKYISLRGIILRTLQVVLTLLLVKSPSDFYLYLVLYAGIPLLQALSLWPFLFSSLDFRQIKKIHPWQHWKPILAFFIPTIATTVYSTVDKVMLGTMTTNAATGYYESAQHIALLATTVFTSIYTVMRSRVCADNEKTTGLIERKIHYFLRVALLIVIPVTFGIISIARHFVIVFFGNGYMPVVPLLRTFSIVIVFLGISGFLSAVYIVPFNKQMYLSLFYIIAAVLNVALNAFLIPCYEAEGAVIGSIAAEMLVLIGCLYLSRKVIPLRTYAALSWKYLVSGAIMLLTLLCIDRYMSSSIVSLFGKIVIGIVLYILGLIILRDSIMWKYIHSVFRRIRRRKTPKTS